MSIVLSPDLVKVLSLYLVSKTLWKPSRLGWFWAFRGSSLSTCTRLWRWLSSSSLSTLHTPSRRWLSLSLSLPPLPPLPWFFRHGGRHG